MSGIARLRYGLWLGMLERKVGVLSGEPGVRSGELWWRELGRDVRLL